jgi:RNA recognition motif-containing protein
LKDRRIYVGNLDYSVTPDELKEQFSYFGRVKYVKLFTGFGFVEMYRTSDAEYSIVGLNQVELKGRKIRVEKARPPVKNGVQHAE